MRDLSYFKFRIRDDKYQLYKKFGAFVFLLNAIAFFYLSAADVAPFTHLLFLFLGGLLSAYSIYCFFSKSKDRSYIVLYVISALAWITELHFLTPAVILIALMIMQILAHYKVYIIIQRDGIIVKSYSERNISWKQVQHLILKDGLLTIDLDKKVIQVYPDFTEPVIIQKGGSLHQQKWNVGEDYDDMETAVNEFYQQVKLRG